MNMTMKKEWSRPQAVVETFAANEYVAACGDSGKTYLFECDAGGGASGGVWQETNGTPGLQKGSPLFWKNDTQLSKSESSYHACGEKHKASSTDEFIMNGYYLKAGDDPKNAIDVVVWRPKEGWFGHNTHCTTNLDINSWETAKS